MQQNYFHFQWEKKQPSKFLFFLNWPPSYDHLLGWGFALMPSLQSM